MFSSQLHEFVQTYLTQPVKQLTASSEEAKHLEMRRRLLARLVVNPLGLKVYFIVFPRCRNGQLYWLLPFTGMFT